MSRPRREDLVKLIQEREWDQVLTRVGISPEEAIVVRRFSLSSGIAIRTFPLHIACMYTAPLKVIAGLIAADQSTCSEKDGLGRTPLYHAICSRSTYDVISVLIGACPQALQVMADDGTLPIHMACLNAMPFNDELQTIRHLLWRCPYTLSVRNAYGYVPRACAEMNPYPDMREAILIEMSCYENRFEFYHHLRGQRNSNQGGNFGIHDARGSGQQSRNNVTDEIATEGQGTISDERKKQETSKQCVICMEKLVSRVLVPCGHPCLCEDCACNATMNRLQWKCPECRTQTIQIVKFFGRIALDG